jgi:hypothetical protein
MAKEQVPEVKLKVAEALQQDVGRGIARICRPIPRADRGLAG